MALRTEQLDALLIRLQESSHNVAETKGATKPKVMNLSREMTAALGTSTRKTIPFLATAVEAISAKLFVKLETFTWAKYLEAIERNLYKAVIRDGVAFVLVSWKDDHPVYTLREAFDGTTGAQVITDSLTGKTLYGVNVWKAGTTIYLDVYYPDKIEKYIKEEDAEWSERKDEGDESWPIQWYTDIPLIKFGNGKSDIADAIQIQRDLNDALLDMLAVSRNQGWPQRYIKGDSEYVKNQSNNYILDWTGQPIRRNLKVEPGSFVTLNKESDIGQLPTADTDTATIDKLLELLSLQTTVPVYYFKNSDWPSGVALVQAETRLNGKVEDKQGVLAPAFKNLFQLSYALSNTYAGTSIDVDVEINWYPLVVETEDLRLDRLTKTASAIAVLDNAGAISIETKVRMMFESRNIIPTDTQIAEEVARINTEKQVVDI